MLTQDTDNRIILWGSRRRALYGYTRAEALGHISHELLQTEASMSIEQIETILHREGVWEGELRHRTRDGRRIVIASQWVLHTDSTGKIICILRLVRTSLPVSKQGQCDKDGKEALEHKVAERTTEWKPETAGEGIVRYRSAPTDLVITDIVIPEQEGLQTIRELRHEFPEVKIIAVSGGGRRNPEIPRRCQVTRRPTDALEAL